MGRWVGGRDALSEGQGSLSRGRQNNRHTPCTPPSRSPASRSPRCSNASTTPSAPCRRSGTPAGDQCCPPPRPPLAKMSTQAHTLASSLLPPHFTRASRGPAQVPGAPRGTARAARRRGRSPTQGASGLASGGKGRDRPRRKQRARSPGAVPAPSLSQLVRFAVLTPVLFIVAFSLPRSSSAKSSRLLPRSASFFPPLSSPVLHSAAPAGAAMRLIQNMCTIAEYPAPGSAAAADYCLGAAGRRLVKIAVVGASGVGKTGESSHSGEYPLISEARRGRPLLGVADTRGVGER